MVPDVAEHLTFNEGVVGFAPVAQQLADYRCALRNEKALATRSANLVNVSIAAHPKEYL